MRLFALAWSSEEEREAEGGQSRKEVSREQKVLHGLGGVGRKQRR